MDVSRRTVLRGIAGLVGLAAVPALAAACGSGAADPSAAGSTTLGSNLSDETPRRAMAAVVEAFTAKTGITVRVNTVDATTFQDQMSAYLQGSPDDVFTWFGGDRMRFFAERGLATDLSDLWRELGDDYSEGFRVASTGHDGKPYLVPFGNYPWVVLYRRSVFEAHGYAPPATLGELHDLATRMRADGLVPFAFGDREGWPAMGTFDILDLRLNGYDFHLALLGGRERWTDPRVRTVFETWRELLPHHQEGALGRTWQEAARTLLAGDAGMYFHGTFAGEQATPEEREDLDMFPFPRVGSPFDDERAIDAPINGFMLRRDPVNPDAARAFLAYLGSGEAQDIYFRINPNRIAASRAADRSGYTTFQHRMAEVIAEAGRLAQFLDRDTRPDFAGPNGMQSFLQQFIAEPDRDIDAHLRTIQDFWDSLEG